LLILEKQRTELMLAVNKPADNLLESLPIKQHEIR
jgi:hypothetical protein